MRLSEAIRLGAMNRPQARGRVLKDEGTCALGAALEAIGESLDHRGWFPVYDHWPIARRVVTYPGDSHRGEEMMLGSACWTLNDADRWTREQIADFVETIEAASGYGVSTQEHAIAPSVAPCAPNASSSFVRAQVKA